MRLMFYASGTERPNFSRHLQCDHRFSILDNSMCIYVFSRKNSAVTYKNLLIKRKIIVKCINMNFTNFTESLQLTD